MFPETKSGKHQDSRENKTNQFPEGPYIKCFVIYLDFPTIVLLYSACGQQLRNCILVGIHLNLIRGT